jgi:tol-pal system protein YbgF
MENFRPFLNGVFVLVLLGHTPFLFAQSPITVEESTYSADATISSNPRTEAFRPPIEEESSVDTLEGQYQLQILQQEVMELRGMLEELNHQLTRMRATAEDRYLELDARFQNLSTRNLTPSATPSSEVPTSPVTEVPQQEEKVLYDTARKLIQNKQYDMAISQLRAVISQYPDGVYAPNAYYWLGEVFQAKPEPDLDSARESLEQVIQFFPEHRKVPDAAFKLGKVYHLLGDCERATVLLSQIVDIHQGKSVATLAENYLRDKVSCGN